MSNWDGKGDIPLNEDLLWFSHRTNLYTHTKVIHYHEESVWLEGEGVVSFNRNHFKPIKTPEQVEKERAVKHAMRLLGLKEADNVSTVRECLAILYSVGLLHNQPKVEALTFKEYYKAIDGAATYFDSWKLLLAGDHIMEAEEEEK